MKKKRTSREAQTIEFITLVLDLAASDPEKLREFGDRMMRSHIPNRK